MNDDTLDTEKLNKCESMMMLKITRLVGIQEKGKEMTAGCITALSNVMVMMLIAMVGKEKSIDYASLVVSRSFKIMNEFKEWQNEQDTNT